MRIPRVHVDILEGGQRRLLGSEAHHLARVLRIRPGAEVVAFDGHGLEARAVVEAIVDGTVMLVVDEPHRSEVEPELDLTLAVALLKGDKLSEVVRKATELGVSRIRPMLCSRCDRGAMSSAKLTRLARVAREAAKQAGRARLPEIFEPAPLEALPDQDSALVAVPGAPSTLAQALSAGVPSALTLVTGPEAGLTADEVEALTRRGATAVRLGARILRAETAPIAMVAALLIPEAQ